MFRSQALLVFVMLSAGGAPALEAQSLGEAAQQEAARRKELKGTSRVITNKDLAKVPPAAASAPGPSGTTPAPPAPPAGNTSPVPPVVDPNDDRAAKQAEASGQRDEKYWRERISRARADVERDRVLSDALQSRIDALTTDFVNRDDPAQRAVIATNRQRAIVELDRLKKAVIDGTKAIAAIEDEARRAGAPPGWLR